MYLCMQAVLKIYSIKSGKFAERKREKEFYLSLQKERCKKVQANGNWCLQINRFRVLVEEIFLRNRNRLLQSDIYDPFFSHVYVYVYLYDKCAEAISSRDRMISNGGIRVPS